MTQSTFSHSETLEDCELVCADTLSLEKENTAATADVTAKKSVEYIRIKDGYFSEYLLLNKNIWSALYNFSATYVL